jgi:hypothetical protein
MLESLSRLNKRETSSVGIEFLSSPVLDEQPHIKMACCLLLSGGVGDSDVFDPAIDSHACERGTKYWDHRIFQDTVFVNRQSVPVNGTKRSAAVKTGRDMFHVVIMILNSQSSIKQQNNRFDGVVGYHVSLTFQLGSLKVSSSSLGRIISFCRGGGLVEKSFFASLPMWVSPCHNRSTADHTTWASATHQEIANWTIRRAFILLLSACVGLGIDIQSRKLSFLEVMSDIVSFESIVY